VCRATNVFLSAVVYGSVFREFFPDLVVNGRSICVQNCLPVYVFFEWLSHALTVNRLKNLRTNITAARYHREYRGLANCPASLNNAFALPLPPLPEQRAIARVLAVVDQKIATEEKRKVALQTLFKTTLHQLMTAQGRVRVPAD
jgi:restriction endonuclease S subunit